MTKQQFDSLYRGKAVHCKIEELANEFLELADSVGYKWYDKEKLTLNNMYYAFKKDTCYRPGGRFMSVSGGDFMSYGDTEIYEMNGFEIVEFKSMKTSPQESLQSIILNRLGVEANEKFRITSVSKYFEFEEYFIDEKLRVFGVGKELAGTVCFPDIATLILEPELIEKLPPKPLLTDEEKEFLKNFEFVELEKENNNGLILYIDQCDYHVIGIKHCKHKFNGLEKCKHYTLKELGL